MDTPNETNEKKFKKPFYKKWWFYLIIVVVVLMVIGSAISTFSDTNDDKGDTPSNTETPDNNTSDKTEEPNDTPELTYYIGDTVTVGKLEYTITKVIDRTILSIDGKIIPTDNNFIEVTFEIKNVSNSAVYFYSSNMTMYRGERSWPATYASAELASTGYYKLNAGLKKTFSLIFEVPDKSTDFDYQLEVKESKESSKITLKQNTTTEE